MNKNQTTVPLNVLEYEAYAHEFLPKNAYDYYASGADEENSLKENRNAFKRLILRPRVLQNVAFLHTNTTILGHAIQSPICIAPTAMQCMAHPLGERASAAAAFSENVAFILSTLSTTSIEHVASANKGGLRWFQLYVFKDRNLTIELVRRAESHGYQAIVLTVDTPVLGRREADERNRFALPSHLHLANFTKIGGEHAYGVTPEDSPSENINSGLAAYIAKLFDPTLNWDDVKWLKSITKLPVVVKGILTPEDAKIAATSGCVDALLVSNHGARQLDGVEATIDALPGVVQAVKQVSPSSPMEVYLDGGIRRGTDAFKALALGARAVFIGRPVLWGLAHSGEEGVKNVLRMLNNELKSAMLFSGTRTVDDITNAHLLLLMFVIQVDDHHHILPELHLAIRQRRLPFDGLHIVHFDAHPDMSFPPDVNADIVFQPNEMYEVLDNSVAGIAEFLLPLIYGGHVQQLTWIKPSWANQIEVGVFPNQLIGKHRENQRLCLSLDCIHFIEEELYVPGNSKEHGDYEEKSIKYWDFCVAEITSNITYEHESLCNTTKAPFTSWILDIDLDYFSTWNPFRTELEQKIGATLTITVVIPIFTSLQYKQNTNDLSPMDRQKHKKQFQALIDTLKTKKLYMNNASVAEREHLKKNLQELYIIDHPDHLMDEFFQLLNTINDQEVLNCIWENGPLMDLPHHESTNDEIDASLNALANYLQSCSSPPSLVTIAQSTGDEFLPPHQLSHVLSGVLGILKDIYGDLQIKPVE